jgi:uncharacterized phage protein gp47/JayE
MRGGTGSEVFMKQDIVGFLRSLRVTTEAALQINGGNADYAQGSRVTLVAVAMGFGIAPHELGLDALDRNT